MNPIKKAAITLTTLTMLGVGALLVMESAGRKAQAVQPTRDGGVVVLLARGDFDLSPRNLVVVISSSSEGAPIVAEGASLAQALQELRAAGFQIQHIHEALAGINYTLIK